MTKNTQATYQNLLLFFASLIVSALLLEITLRVVFPPPIIWKYPQEHYIFDPEIGHWLEPSQHAYTHDKTVQTNSAGIRDKEYTERPQSNVYRILALGDSQTFGNGLLLDDSWPKQLERFLNQNQEHDSYEIINSGLPGSDTWQHEIILERFIPKYYPDAVILAFYVNDVTTRFTPVKQDSSTTSPMETKLIYLVKRSALLLALRTTIQTIRQSFSPSRGFSQELALFSGASDTPLDKRWQQVETSLSRMKSLCDQTHTKFMVVALPRRDQVSGQTPWEGYYKQLRRITSRHHIALTSMLEPLKDAYGKNGKDLFIPWDGHNSRLANKIIASNIANSLSASNKSDTGNDANVN